MREHTYNQISFFDGSQPLRINKPIRLIELFAGYGSQALALKYLGVEFEHWRIAEWAINSIQAYKDLHFADDHTDYSASLTNDEVFDKLFAYGISSNYDEPMTKEQIRRLGGKKARTVYNNLKATHNLSSVCNATGADFGITDTDKYTYIMTYSFPCQDLSNAGLHKGMGIGTRSGLLWEVERILREMSGYEPHRIPPSPRSRIFSMGGYVDTYCPADQSKLPQILLMENVPQVVGKENMPLFAKWLQALEELGYKSKYRIINASEFGVPQSRDRCFMVSWLGDYYYDFPRPIGCELILKDLLQKNVPESYYLKEGTIIKLNEHKARHEAQGHGFGWKSTDGGGYEKTIKTTAGWRHTDTFIAESSEKSGIDVKPDNCAGGGVRNSQGSDQTGLRDSGGRRQHKSRTAKQQDASRPHRTSESTDVDDEPATGGRSPEVIDAYNGRYITAGLCGTITTKGNRSKRQCGTFFVVEENND